MTHTQQRLLNALCGELARHVCFNERGKYSAVADCPTGTRLHKDDWRHALAGKAKGDPERYIPDWDSPEKQITLGTSSLRLTIEEAGLAIDMAYELGARCGVVFRNEGTEPENEAREVAVIGGERDRRTHNYPEVTR